MQKSSHSVEPVSQSHLHANTQWSKHRPMTSFQEWATCGGAANTQVVAKFHQRQGKAKKKRILKKVLLPFSCAGLSISISQPYYFFLLLFFLFLVFLELCRESTWNELSKRHGIVMSCCFAWWIFGWDGLNSVKLNWLVRSGEAWCHWLWWCYFLFFWEKIGEKLETSSCSSIPAWCRILWKPVACSLTVLPP